MSGGSLCKSLVRGVLMGHLTIINLILKPYSRLDTKIPNLFQTGYFLCKHLIIIAGQHTLTKQKSYKVTSEFHFCYRALGKEACSTLNYLYAGHFSGKLYPILDQNCPIFILSQTCLKTTLFTVAHTYI